MYIVLDLYSTNEKFCILMTEVLKNLLKFFLFTFPTEAVTMMFQFINDLKDEPVRDLILTASLCRYLIILLARHEAGCVPLFSSLASLFSRICKLPVQFKNGFDTVRMKSNRKPKIFNYLKYPANITSQFDSSLTCTIRCERRSFEEKLLCWVCTIVQNCNTRVIYVDIKRYMENTDLRWKEKQSASQPYQKYRPLWKTKLHFHHL